MSDLPYREAISRAVRVVPVVAGVVAVFAVVLGGSIGVSIAIGAVGALTAIPIVRGSLPHAPRHVIAGWIGLLALVIPTLAVERETFGLAAVAGIALILFARLIAHMRIRWVVLATVISIQAAGWAVSGRSMRDLWILLGMAVVAFGTEYLTALNRVVALGSADRVRQLSDERWSLIRLYEIASSIGTSTTKAEALPDLLSSIAEAVGGRVCAVALHGSDTGRLSLVGPVWVNGLSVSVDDDVSITLAEGGFGSRALRSSRAIRFDRSTVGSFRAITEELGLESGLVVPLWVEGRASGLLIVGDPLQAAFSRQAIDSLTDLAAPAGLVLAQVERHESAALLAERLQEIADMKTDLVSMVSHELRTPLTAVIGSLDILNRPDVAADEDLAHELVSTASRQAHRLKRLIDDLLTISRMDRGLVRPEPAVVSLEEVLSEAVWVLGDVPVTVSVPDGMAVIADPHHLSQVIINLLENATKYAPGSRIEVAVERLGRDDVVIAVVDHGPGIPAAHRERVFERFVRLPGAHQAGGTGLGLAIVAMLIESMGGRIDVLDTPGGGATFALSLASADRISPVRPAA